MGIVTLACGILLAADPLPPQRVVTPEGWLEVERGPAEEAGTLTVVPAPPASGQAVVSPPVETPPPAEPLPPPPLARRRPRPCRAQLEQLLGRMTYLHELTLDFEGVPVSPATVASLYPWGSAFANPNQPPIELGWDTEVRDLFLAYNRCLVRSER